MNIFQLACITFIAKYFNKLINLLTHFMQLSAFCCAKNWSETSPISFRHFLNPFWSTALRRGFLLGSWTGSPQTEDHWKVLRGDLPRARCASVWARTQRLAMQTRWLPLERLTVISLPVNTCPLWWTHRPFVQRAVLHFTSSCSGDFADQFFQRSSKWSSPSSCLSSSSN